ncbi:unnamed protein product [Penicillium salamii]|nr:unnamed protein product [Penicillium salamii]
MADTTPRKIVVVGGGVAGISLAHYLLRYTLPALTERLEQPYHLTLVSPSSHFYWKVAAPRALVEPSQNNNEPFVAIADGFKDYPASQFTFSQAEAIQVDEKARILHAKSPRTNENTSVKYDCLVIATGTSSHSPLFSLKGPHTQTKNELEHIQDRLRDAQSILVAGGGPTGVETAGELGAMSNRWPGAKKSITILSGHERLLSHASPGTSATAESKLDQLGVAVNHGVRVNSAIQREQGEKSWDLTLSDQSTRVVDVYIDATGSTPNTAFLPSAWLDASGYVKTDQSSLRLEDAAGVYALGSVTSFTNGSFFDAVEPVRPLADSIRDDELAINPDASRRGQTWWETFFGRRTREYRQKVSLTQFVAVGRDGGVGELGGWRVPSALVYKAKARTLMLEKMGPIMHASFRLKLQSLSADTTFEFIDGPFESEPAPDVAPFYSPPYYSFWQGKSVPAIREAHRQLQEKLDRDGPYNGVLCFSQGCSLIASYLLYHERMHPDTPPPFRLAVFICGGVPLPILEDLGLPISSQASQWDEETSRLLMSKNTDHSWLARNTGAGHGPGPGIDRWAPAPGALPVIHAAQRQHYINKSDVFGLDLTCKPDDMRIRIPTVHICGSRDPRFPAAVQLHALCDEAPLWDHGGGHDIPRGRETSQRIAELMVKGMSRGEEWVHPVVGGLV